MIKPETSGRENKVDLAFSISLKFADGSPSLIEKFDGEPLNKTYTDLPAFITGLFPAGAITTDWCIKASRNNLVWVAPCIDDRMFVVSWYDGPSNNILAEEKREDMTFAHTDFWYKYIYIDKQHGESHKNEEWLVKLLAKSTYDRWEGLK